MKKPRIIFRAGPLNRISLPVLFNSIERSCLHRNFSLLTVSSPDQIRPGDMVFYSFMTPQAPAVHREIKILKERGVFLAAGGAHASSAPELTLQMGFDAAFCEAGEESLVLFLKKILKNSSPADLCGIHRSPDRSESSLQYQPFSQYLNTLPPLEIMRGCRWKCAYCATPNRGLRFRSFSSVLRYLQELKRRKASRVNFICPSALEYRFPDSNGTDSLQAVEKILSNCRRMDFRHVEYGIFPSEIRPETLTPGFADLLKRLVTNHRLTIGAQSGVSDRLRKIRRGHTTAHIEQSVDIANSAGFAVNLDFIIGFPDESREEFMQTIEFIKALHARCRIHAQIHYFFPLPATAYGLRLPAAPDTQMRTVLHNMHKNGIITNQWEYNEREVIDFFAWLKAEFPQYYSMYS